MMSIVAKCILIEYISLEVYIVYVSNIRTKHEYGEENFLVSFQYDSVRYDTIAIMTVQLYFIVFIDSL